ncbi:MAG: ATP-binding protein [Chitinivibrionales bacterium]|nr:ATP-binding protein [Chitinivibrionales bacterium]
MMIQRDSLRNDVKAALSRSRVVALVGPRQCGKTTLAREFISVDSLNYFDLEDPLSLVRLEEPMTGLKDLIGTVVIDEIQRKPELFPILRVLADRVPLKATFLILGSASPGLIQRSSESLAGRIEIIEMKGFSLEEAGIKNHERHWLRGGLPPSYLADSDISSDIWRKNYTKTVSERDIVQLGHSIPSTTIVRFWTMLAHYHGNIWNAAEPARSLGIGESSVRRYLDLLTDIFMIRQLKPWHAAIQKRQVKSPKVYFTDSGILHQLLGIKTAYDLLSHPKCGLSWEGYIIEELMQIFKSDEVYFWSTHNNAEIDLLLTGKGRKIGIECKRSDAPKVTPSMRIALDDLKLSEIFVIYPGDKSYLMADKIHAVAFQDMVSFFKKYLTF